MTITEHLDNIEAESSADDIPRLVAALRSAVRVIQVFPNTEPYIEHLAGILNGDEP